jgi:hypothetical protein
MVPNLFLTSSRTWSKTSVFLTRPNGLVKNKTCGLFSKHSEIWSPYGTLPPLQSLIYGWLASSFSYKVGSKSSIWWSCGLKWVQIRPHFDHLTLCWERRLTFLNDIITHGRSEKRVAKVLENRLILLQSLLGVILWVVSHFSENTMKSTFAFPNSAYTVEGFRRNVKPWPRTHSEARSICASRPL